jgi:hypothetical protein
MPDYKIMPDYTVLCRIIQCYAGLYSVMPDLKNILDYAALCRIITNNFYHFVCTGLGSNRNIIREQGTGRVSDVMTQCSEKSYGGTSLVRSLVSPCHRVGILRQY